jgi:SEC-C motif
MRSPVWSPDRVDDRSVRASAILSVFWPELELSELVARWPHLADEVGATWDEHRRNVERFCAIVERESGLTVKQVAGDLRSFEAFLGRRGVRIPAKDDLLAYPDARDAVAVWKEWPPDRTAGCWCGSGRKYKLCCRPYGLGSLDAD